MRTGNRPLTASMIDRPAVDGIIADDLDRLGRAEPIPAPAPGADANKGYVQIHARTARVRIAGQHAIGSVQATGRAPCTGHCLDRGRSGQCRPTYAASSDPLLTAANRMDAYADERSPRRAHPAWCRSGAGVVRGRTG